MTAWRLVALFLDWASLGVKVCESVGRRTRDTTGQVSFSSLVRQLIGQQEDE